MTTSTASRDAHIHYLLATKTDERWQIHNTADTPDEPVQSGSLLSTRSGQLMPAAEALAGKIVALYFSASWCPPCKLFTPVLKAAYEAANKSGKKFEVVWVSSDYDAASQQAYMEDKHGDWLQVRRRFVCGWEGAREGGREGASERGREGRRDGGREGGRDGRRDGRRISTATAALCTCVIWEEWEYQACIGAGGRPVPGGGSPHRVACRAASTIFDLPSLLAPRHRACWRGVRAVLACDDANTDANTDARLQVTHDDPLRQELKMK